MVEKITNETAVTIPVNMLNIKQGQCNSGNAIELLRIKGYPESVVQHALRLSMEIASMGGMDIKVSASALES